MRRTTLLATVRSAVLAATLACALPAAAQSIDPTAATVKLTKVESISVKALSAQIAVYEQIYKQQGQQFGDRERTDVLWLLIDKALYRQAAARDHVRVTDEQLKLLMDQQRQILAAQVGRAISDAELRQIVLGRGLTWEQWLEELKDSAIPQLYVAQIKAASVQKRMTPPTDKEIEQYYRSSLQDFVIGDIVEFRHIFVETRGKTKEERDAARRKIDEAALKLRNGAKFEDLAAQYSEDTETKDRGGYSGFLQANKPEAQALGSSFTEGAFALEEGQTSGVLQSTAGYHIVKVIRKIPGKLYGLDEKTPPTYQTTARGAIREALLAARQQDAITAEIEATKLELRSAAEIKIQEKNLGFPLQQAD